MLNQENYTYCRFTQDRFATQINIGANVNESTEPIIEYWVHVFKIQDDILSYSDQDTLFQKSFKSLELAIDYANNYCQKWKFVDLIEQTKNENKDSCSTCGNKK